MKRILKIFVYALFLFAFIESSAQTSASKQKSGKPGANEEQHIAIGQFPKDMVINHLNGWGGMTVSINELPAGTDFGPLLEGLKNNSCQVPHWGYILKGSMRVNYDGGKEVVLKTGDVFYLSPGHKAFVVEDLKLMDFSPEREMKELINHVEKKVAAAKQQ